MAYYNISLIYFSIFCTPVTPNIFLFMDWPPFMKISNKTWKWNIALIIGYSALDICLIRLFQTLSLRHALSQTRLRKKKREGLGLGWVNLLCRLNDQLQKRIAANQQMSRTREKRLTSIWNVHDTGWSHVTGRRPSYSPGASPPFVYGTPDYVWDWEDGDSWSVIFETRDWGGIGWKDSPRTETLVGSCLVALTGP